MLLVLAITVGGLYAAGLYMMMRRSIVKLLIGLALISHAANLLIFTAGGVVRGVPPLVPEGQQQLTTPSADPLPQALILTAIVISFGLLAFSIVLVSRLHESSGEEDLDAFQMTDS